MTPIAAALELPGRGGTESERLALADAAVERAVLAGARLVLLPEAFLPGYAHVAAEAGAAARAWMGEVAARRGVTVAMGYLDGRWNVLGLTTPDGRHTAYRKRFPSPDEARVWTPGSEAGIAETPVGTVGLLVCADVLHVAAWRPFVGRVDAVFVAAAWPDYRGRLATVPRPLRPGARWLFHGSNPYRRELLGRAARAVGAPVLFANATGPYEGEEEFSGGTCAYDASGAIVSEGAVATVALARATPGPPLRHAWRWAAFTAVYRGASVTRGAIGPILR